MNPGAVLTRAVRGDIAADALFGGGAYAPNGRRVTIDGWFAPHAHDGHVGSVHHMHHMPHNHASDITHCCIVRDAPLHAVTLSLLLTALAENCGADMLRMKGIVNVREDPARPAVIHGVQHVYHAPVWLPRWPSADHRTRLVFIGRNLSERWLRELIELIEEEVASETARLTR
jgi:G3E family GTPase